MRTKDLLISKINNREPINVKVDGFDLGTFTYNRENKRYTGFGYISIERIKEILESDSEEWEWIEIE